MQSSRRRWMPVVALWGSLLAMAVQAAPAEQGAAAPPDLSSCLVRPAVHKGLQQLVDAGQVGTVGARLVFSKPDAPPRIAVEAGVTDGWWKYGCDAVIGLDTYGESAPAGVLFKHFGFTTDNVVATVRKVLSKKK
jgi:hypothetical protein